MESKKGVWTRAARLSARCTPQNKILSIRHVMVISPLRAVIGIAQSGSVNLSRKPRLWLLL